MTTDTERGLYAKYEVRRLHDENGKHDDCEYFVLDPHHDPIARLALSGYAVAAEHRGYTALAADLRAMIQRGQKAEDRDRVAALGQPHGQTGNGHE